MRVDCYNPAEVLVNDVICGETFYLNGDLYIKVSPNDVDIIAPMEGRCYIVKLSTGVLKSIKTDAPVIKADTKIVAGDTPALDPEPIFPFK